MSENDCLLYLSKKDMTYADEIARKRHATAVAKGRKATYGYGQRFSDGEDGLEKNRIGTHTELAVALFTNLPWNAFLDNLRSHGAKPPDVGPFIQVRGHREFPVNELYVHPDDPVDHIYVLALWHAKQPELVRLAGWCPGWEAKAWPTEEPQSGRPCHVGLESQLRSMSRLYRIRERCA